MEMLRATILERGMDDILWPEVVLAMTHVKNLRPTRALDGLIRLKRKIRPNQALNTCTS